MGLKFFIPGGAGYIGSVLSEALLRQGHAVTVLDNFYYNQNSLLSVIREKNLTLVKGDIRDVSALRPYLSQADVVSP